MNFNEMETEALVERRTAIAAEVEKEGADLDALETEVRGINEELEKRKNEAAKKAEIRDMVSKGAGVVIEKFEMEERKMPAETRNTKAYIDAYAEYLKTGEDKECRALLSTNGTDASASLTGYVPVPEFVEGRIRTAWEKSDLMALVRHTNLKGNVKVGFELTADGAVVHKEGTAAPNEEVITLGIVTMIPQSIKKWITVSDEALDLTGEDFINYIYDELTYRIAKKAEEILLDMIVDLPDTPTATSVSAQAISAAPAIGTVSMAESYIVGGRDLTLVMNRRTWAMFKAVQYANNYYVDPFEGRKIVFSDYLPAYGEADEGDVYMVVGDFFEGAQANFPSGDMISVKVDNLSLAEKDLVKFVGREFVGMGIVSPNKFTLVKKPANP